jgi:hypothetical protein
MAESGADPEEWPEIISAAFDQIDNCFHADLGRPVATLPIDRVRPTDT